MKHAVLALCLTLLLAQGTVAQDGPPADPPKRLTAPETEAAKTAAPFRMLSAWLDALNEPLDAAALRTHFTAMLEKLHAGEGRVEVRFPFFIRKRAPVSGLESLLDYQGSWVAEMRDGKPVVWSQVLVPVKSLCPCSKEISDYGAHNQRSHVTIRAELLQDVPWGELVRFAENAASSEIWPMLKRADEKWVTEHAYENPKFVEDLVRDVALGLNADARIGRYTVDVENFESIHNHSAFARIERL
jgi:GTP cyclohydrolase I